LADREPSVRVTGGRLAEISLEPHTQLESSLNTMASHGSFILLLDQIQYTIPPTFANLKVC
jgi:hypothetical protein